MFLFFLCVSALQYIDNRAVGYDNAALGKNTFDVIYREWVFENGFDGSDLTCYSGRYTVIGAMHKCGLLPSQISYLTGHSTQAVMVYIRQEELDEDRYGIMNKFQSFLRNGNADRCTFDGLHFFDGYDYESLRELDENKNDDTFTTTTNSSINTATNLSITTATNTATSTPTNTATNTSINMPPSQVSGDVTLPKKVLYQVSKQLDSLDKPMIDLPSLHDIFKSKINTNKQEKEDDLKKDMEEKPLITTPTTSSPITTSISTANTTTATFISSPTTSSPTTTSLPTSNTITTSFISSPTTKRSKGLQSGAQRRDFQAYDIQKYAIRRKIEENRQKALERRRHWTKKMENSINAVRKNEAIKQNQMRKEYEDKISGYQQKMKSMEQKMESMAMLEIQMNDMQKRHDIQMMEMQEKLNESQQSIHQQILNNNDIGNDQDDNVDDMDIEHGQSPQVITKKGGKHIVIDIRLK